MHYEKNLYLGTEAALKPQLYLSTSLRFRNEKVQTAQIIVSVEPQKKIVFKNIVSGQEHILVQT